MTDELELYVKYTAWLYSAPRVDPKSKAQREPRAVKFQRLIDAGRSAPALEPPEVTNGQYLLEYLSEIGEARSNGNTLSPIDWEEITAWQHLTGTDLSTWDARMLRHLSSVYVASYHKAEDPNCPPPWMPEQTSEKQLTRRLDQLIGAVSKHD